MAAGWLALMVATGAVYGEGTELSLTWRAPEACADGPAVLEAIRALGRPLSHSARSSPLLTLDAEVRRIDGPGGFQAELRFLSSAGESVRTLEARDCGALVDAVALIVALALDQEAARDEAPAAVETATVAPARPVFVAGSRPPVLVPKWRPILAAGVLGAVGGLPTPSVGVAVRVGARRGRFELDAGWVVRLPRRVRLGEGNEGGKFSIIAGSVRGCWAPVVGPLTVDACLGAEVGELRAAGVGFDDAERSSELWLAGWAEIAPALRIDARWWLTARLRGLVPVRRPRYALENSDDTFQVSVVAADLVVEATLHF